MLTQIGSIAVVLVAGIVLYIAGALLADLRARTYMIGRLIGRAVRRRVLRWLGFQQDPKASPQPPETIDAPTRWLD